MSYDNTTTEFPRLKDIQSVFSLVSPRGTDSCGVRVHKISRFFLSVSPGYMGMYLSHDHDFFVVKVGYYFGIVLVYFMY